MTLDIRYDIHTRVKIKELDNLAGRVIGVFYGGKLGPEYKVRHFINGEYKEVYFLEDELCLAEYPNGAFFCGTNTKH